MPDARRQRTAARTRQREPERAMRGWKAWPFVLIFGGIVGEVALRKLGVPSALRRGEVG